MNRIASGFALIALGLLASEAAAQARPNFAGQWSTDAGDAVTAQRGGRAGGGARGGARAGRGGARAGAGAARGRAGGGGRGLALGSGWGPNFTISQDADSLVVEYAFFSRSDLQPPLHFAYALDGSESISSVMMGRGIQEQRSTATWDEETLVIQTTFPFTNPQTGDQMSVEVTRRLTLESPDSLVVETTRGGVLGGEPVTTRTVYTRQSG